MKNLGYKYIIRRNIYVKIKIRPHDTSKCILLFIKSLVLHEVENVMWNLKLDVLITYAFTIKNKNCKLLQNVAYYI
jgi:hypothetical protein